MTLADRVLAGDARAIARAISLIEDEDPAGAGLIQAIFGRTGRAYLVGVTGPPGAGKSTLVDRLIAHFRQPGRPVLVTREHSARGPSERAGASEASGGGAPRALNDAASASGVGVGPHAGLKVGVVAVDPTSPFTGGAVLGDRLRMQSHAADEDVFIRSMATRGHLGGLARATGDAALVLDAAGKDIVIIETVGVGQDEVDIVRTADVSIVTLVPGAGDEVQALKAGIMEIADIFVVNKADREGAERLAAAIEANLGLHAYGADEWRPPIVQTVATSGRGVPELVDAIEKFREHTARSGAGPSARSNVGPSFSSGETPDLEAGAPTASRRRQRAEHRLRELVAHVFMERLERDVLKPGELAAMADRIAAREIDPYTAAAMLLERGRA